MSTGPSTYFTLILQDLENTRLRARIELEGMIAENLRRASEQSPPYYTESDFAAFRDRVGKELTGLRNDLAKEM